MIRTTKTRSTLALLVIFSLAGAHGTIFHTPNPTCDARDLVRACPTLCRKIGEGIGSICPAQAITLSFQEQHPERRQDPVCSLGHIYCPPRSLDKSGICRRGNSFKEACGDQIINPCDVGEEGESYVPCPQRLVRTKIDYGTDLSDIMKMTMETCRNVFLGTPLSQDEKLAFAHDLHAAAAHRRGDKDLPLFKASHPVYIIFLAYVLVTLAFPVAWIAYKSHHERAFDRQQRMKGTPSSAADMQIGYTSDTFGTFVQHALVTSTLGWCGWLVLLILDHYHLLFRRNDTDGYDTIHPLFGNDDARATAFIVTWHTTVFWVAALSLATGGPAWQAWFRRRVSLDNATHVFFPDTTQDETDDECLENDKSKPTSIKSGVTGTTDDSVEEHHHARDPTIRLGIALQRLQRRILARIASPGHMLPVECTTEPGPSGQPTRYVVHQCTRYVWNADKGSYCVREQSPDPYAYLPEEENVGTYTPPPCLTQRDAMDAMNHQYGPNDIPLKVPTFLGALGEELTGSCFYGYQLMCMFVWFDFTYWRMALIISTVVAVSALIKVRAVRLAKLRVAAMSSQTATVTVLRRTSANTTTAMHAATATCDGKLVQQQVATSMLVPGDVIVMRKDDVVPADCALIQKGCVMDESMLTGEAMPVQKFPLALSSGEDAGARRVFQKDGPGLKSTLFAGTRVLQTACEDGHEKTEEDQHDGDGTMDTLANETLAVVLQTGVHTDKGAMIRSILYPSPLNFVFDADLQIVLIILFIWGCCAATATVVVSGGTTVHVWFYAIFAISQVISPLLPAVLVVGQSVAAKRLEDSEVFCVDFRRITVAGKVRLFCFDKTGTLTKEGLEFVAVHPVQLPQTHRLKAAVPTVVAMNKQLSHLTSHLAVMESDDDNVEAATEEEATPAADEDEEMYRQGTYAAFTSLEEEPRRLPSLLQKGMACAHTVGCVGDDYVGPPVDVEMWRACRWNMRTDHPEYPGVTVLTSPQGKRQLRVLRTFPFEHALMRMTVIVVDRHDDVHVYTKGSFEAVKALCQATSIPPNYDAMCAEHAVKGCYTLSLAHKRLGNLADATVTMEDVTSFSRGFMEADLELLGLLLFRNNLKPDTTHAIKELKKGHVRPVMITGDNALTGIYIARACHMTHRSTRHIYMGDVDKVTGELIWEDVDNHELVDVEGYFERGHEGEDISDDEAEVDETMTAAVPTRIPDLRSHAGREGLFNDAEGDVMGDNDDFDEVTSIGASTFNEGFMSPIGSSFIRPSSVHSMSTICPEEELDLDRSPRPREEALKAPSSIRSNRKRRIRRLTNSSMGSSVLPNGATAVGMAEAEDGDNFELAITGAAFRNLCDRGLMAKYLLSTRIFARMTPEDKVACVKLHMKRAVTGMAGDGGNDTGALRASHVGIALSDTDASMVSPFTGKSKSVQACVELVRQGRCALATSFASYKFLIIYGFVIIFLKLIGLYLSTLPSEAVFISLDSVIMMTLSWALTQAPPKGTLSQRRPTARLLGIETISSIIGMILINLIFLVISFSWYFGADDFYGKHFDGNAVSMAQWWTMSDNFEASIIAILSMFQMVTAAACFNLGGEFRRSWWRNGALTSMFSVLFVALTVMLMAPPNQLGCLFRIQCGNDWKLQDLGYNPQGLRSYYHNELQHNIFSLQNRYVLLAIVIGNAVLNMMFQYIVILGPGRRFFRRKRPLRRLQLKH